MIATCSPTQLPLCSFPRQPFIGFSSQLSLSVRLLSLILFVLHPSQQAARQRQSCKNGRRPPLCSPLTPGTRGGGGGTRGGTGEGWGASCGRCPPPLPPPPPIPARCCPCPPPLPLPCPCPFCAHAPRVDGGRWGGKDEHKRAKRAGRSALKIEILFSQKCLRAPSRHTEDEKKNHEKKKSTTTKKSPPILLASPPPNPPPFFPQSPPRYLRLTAGSAPAAGRGPAGAVVAVAAVMMMMMAVAEGPGRCHRAGARSLPCLLAPRPRIPRGRRAQRGGAGAVRAPPPPPPPPPPPRTKEPPSRPAALTYHLQAIPLHLCSPRWTLTAPHRVGSKESVM